MKLSLVICTYNRADQLKRSLARIAEIRSAVAWELVLVDNASTDETPNVITNFMRSAPFPVVRVYEELHGNGRCRNAGVAVAHGDIIAFSDDDCYPASDYVDQVLKVFEDPRIGFAGGRLTLYDPDDYAITIKELESPQVFEPRSFIPAGEIHGANMMFRKSVLDEINGFDNDFGAGAKFSGDDIDACGRASFAGWWGMYAPTAVVAHHHGRKESNIPALKRRYAIGRGAYLAKFTLNRASSKIYARVWLDRLCHFVSLGPRNCLQELYGAEQYLCHRMTLLMKQSRGRT